MKITFADYSEHPIWRGQVPFAANRIPFLLLLITVNVLLTTVNPLSPVSPPMMRRGLILVTDPRVRTYEVYWLQWMLWPCRGWWK